jgi:gas vesicle protein|tara:strand:- start:42 stop:401 length:360 start_codon:yes stop_codon:yes gene_type:complete
MGLNKPKLKEIIKKEIVEILTEADPEDIKAQQDLNKELETTKSLADEVGDALSEQDDEPTASDLKSDSVASLARELGKITREMKTVVNQWKKSEGEEKEDLLKRLKELTAMKKEVEALL